MKSRLPELGAIALSAILAMYGFWSTYNDDTDSVMDNIANNSDAVENYTDNDLNNKTKIEVVVDLSTEIMESPNGEVLCKIDKGEYMVVLDSPFIDKETDYWYPTYKCGKLGYIDSVHISEKPKEN